MAKTKKETKKAAKAEETRDAQSCCSAMFDKMAACLGGNIFSSQGESQEGFPCKDIFWMMRQKMKSCFGGAEPRAAKGGSSNA
ncbi:MAG: hypothetical protein JSV08_05820 [Acidobacteriota bacterium]|nr:MAG: hypothetical protein JSV08_05820 [Acidobacteriota bacterium]